VLRHLPIKIDRKNTTHPRSRWEVITTRKKLWSARKVRTKTTSMGSFAIGHTTSTLSGTTTMWSHSPRPSSKRQNTFRPRRMSLNRRKMNTMRRVVYVLPARLRNLLLISLSPKEKISQLPIPLTILTVEPHLSLRWNLLMGGGFFWMVEGL
jgi:hypothetical protein